MNYTCPGSRNAAFCARHLFAILSLLLLAAGAQAQTQNSYAAPTVGSTPLGLSPGSPAGSYALSGFDNVNLFNGHLNFRLPMLAVGGRGAAQYPITLKIEQKWHVEHVIYQPPPPGPCDPINCDWPPPSDGYLASPVWWAGLEPGYGPGVMQGRRSGQGARVCGFASATTKYFDQTLTRLTFTAPDGTEFDLRDQLTGGTPYDIPQYQQCNPGMNRGRVFVTDDGSAATFVSDADIIDQNYDSTGFTDLGGGQVVPDPTGMLFNPSGWLFMRDGTRYRIEFGQVTWITDRNGNQVHVDTFSNPQTFGITITDSLKRTVTISYAYPARMYDEITYTGFDPSTPRSIKIHYGFLAGNLISGVPQQIYQLFGANFVNNSDDFNPSVVDYLELPDGRQYQFRYNVYGELARVVLPTGGKIEYDYDGGLGPNPNSGLIVCPNMEIYRRVVTRRVYSGSASNTLESTTTYSKPESSTNCSVSNLGYVDVEQRDAGANLLTMGRHYFFGGASPTMFRQPNEYSFWSDGKENKTKEYDTDGLTVLRQIDHMWERGTLLAQQPGPANAPQNARIRETLATLSDTSPSQVSKQEFDYDVHNNKTEVREYDFGSGSPGTLVRKTHTNYVVSNLGVSYTTVNPSNASPDANATVHLRSLPSQESVYDNADVEKSRTTYEYDTYTAGLLNRSNIVGHASAQTEPTHTYIYLTRGNVTQVTKWILGPSDTGLLSRMQYDIAGNALSVTDPKNNTTTFDFNDRFGSPDGEAQSNTPPSELSKGLMTYAFATRVVNAAPFHHETYAQFHYYLGKPVNGEDPNGVVTSARYAGFSDGSYADALDRPTELVVAVNTGVQRRTRFRYYDSEKRIYTESDQNNFTDAVLKSESFYDGLGRTIKTQQYVPDTGGFVVTEQKYDGMGRSSQTSNPYRIGDIVYWTTTVYDGLSRVKTVTTPDSATVTTSYLGNKTTVRDQANKQRRSVTDGLGRLTSVDEMLEYPSTTVYATTTYSYDVLDDLTTVTQTQQSPSVTQTRRFAYDSLKRLIFAANPEQATSDSLLYNGQQWAVKYEYDNDSNLLKKTDSRTDQSIQLLRVEYAYDELNRINTRTYFNDQQNTPAVTYTYDGSGINFSKGRLTRVSNSVSTTDYLEFDPLGRVKQTKQTTAGGASQGYTLGYSYNLAGEMRTETYPSGRVITTSYDSTGRISQVSGQQTGESNQNYASAFSYAPHGAISSMLLGNSKWEHMFFNNRLQPYEIGLGASNGASDLLKLEYTYGTSTNNGNVLSQTITVPHFFAGNVVLTQNYTYDALNRLLAASENAGSSSWMQTYDYDRYGNRAVRSMSAAINPSTYIPNPLLTPQSANSTDFSAFTQSTNRLAMSGFDYDPAGNLKNDPNTPTNGIVYDAENRQTSYNKSGAGGGVTTYSYDGDGRRVKKTDPNNATTVFVYNAVGQLIAEYISGTPPGGGTSYLTSDHLGSTRVVTTSTGGVKARYDYLPFGEEISWTIGGRGIVEGYGASDGTRQKFTQKERDSESGLDYFLARYYSSAQGRFTSPDEFTGGPDELFDFSGAASSNPTFYADLTDPQSLNKYQYCYNNPLLYIDPDGHQGFKKFVQDTLRGAAAAFNQDNGLPAPSGDQTTTGRTIGHLAAITQSVTEVVIGGNMIVGGATEAVGTAPAATTGVGAVIPAAGVGVAIGGAALVVHGGAVLINTGVNIFSKKGSSQEGQASQQNEANGQTQGQQQQTQQPAASDLSRLSRGEIRNLQKKGIDPHDLKPKKGGSRFDLFKDKDGNIYVLPKSGKGEPDPTGVKIN